MCLTVLTQKWSLDEGLLIRVKPVSRKCIVSFIKRMLVTVLCFFAAIACYVFGIPAGGVVFFVLGVVFEAMFWFGLLGKKAKK